MAQDNPLTDPERFHAWAEHPLTQAYRQFLKDRLQAAAMLWAQASVPSDQMQVDQTRAETWGDLAHLSCDDVRGFYGMDEVTE